MRTNQSSHRVVTRAWISGESPALEALSRHAKRSTLHEHSDSCARQAVCKRADRTELSHSAIIAQGDLRAYRCMSATGTRGECTVASNICAPNDNVQALSLYEPNPLPPAPAPPPGPFQDPNWQQVLGPLPYIPLFPLPYIPLFPPSPFFPPW